ncbi:DUF2391 family protein [Halomarina rubra]|uniref:DUF2391 family protein n=1 Tax=Halomarina rubra TaxID=2071873 RepID=A0ABD6ARI0_9EURY|nr:DUF2391 family protein [Halomarina rubra]
MTAGRVLRDQGRGVCGALLVVGVPMLYTVEVWWYSWQTPSWRLLVVVSVGLTLVLLVTRRAGFRETDDGDSDDRSAVRLVTDFTELLLQGFLTGLLVLVLFGLVEPATPPTVVARLGLVLTVPLAFGSALANEVLRAADDEQTDDDDDDGGMPPLGQRLALYGLGASFLALPVAPTEEVQVVASLAGWGRLTGLLVASLAFTYLVLYELEFRGQRGRRRETVAEQVGHTGVVYAVSVTVSLALLAAFDLVEGVSLSVVVQQTVVLAFPATVGASGARVVLG